MKIEILYEDPQLVLINKPAGLPVHETLDKLRPNVHKLVEKQLDQKLVLFHRLDLDTTGVLLFGRDPAVNGALSDLFLNRQLEKKYWAIVDGRWPEKITEVKTFIKKMPGGTWANVPKGKGGDFAHSHFKVLKTIGAKTWLEVQLETGRTHQIRLHCLEHSHPILGDRNYGRPDRANVPMALHARSLRFAHPTTGKEIFVEAPEPSYWEEYWLKGF